MAVRPIVKWPEPVLSQRCALVSDLTDDIHVLAADMLETMYDAPGRGLAAPQVGVSLRLFVMDAGWKEGAPDPLVCINPVVEPLGDAMATQSEGCLSIPGVSAEVTRPAAVHLTWIGVDGARHARDLNGFAAACAQHEYDHLDGILTLDRIDPDARADLERTYESLAK